MSGTPSLRMQPQHANIDWKASALSRFPRRATAASQKTTPKRHRWEERWNIVWCHERSRKQDCQEVRAALTRHAQNSHARLVCLRKAKDFINVFSMATEPYVLFTDLREVKLIIEAMNRHRFERRPIFTVVFCIDAKQQQKASRWVSNLNEPKDSIYLVGDLSTIDPIVPQLLLQAAQAICDHNDPATSEKEDETAPRTFQLSKDELQVAPTCHSSQPTPEAVQALPTSQSSKQMKHDTKGLPMFHFTEPMPLVFQQSEPKGDDVRALPRLALIQPKDGAQAHQVFKLVQMGKDYRNLSCAFPQLQSTTCEMLALINLKDGMQAQLTQVKNEDLQECQQMQLKVDEVYAPHVAQVVGTFPNAAEVERALLAAVPEYYED